MTCLPVGEAGPLLYVMRIPHVTKVAVKPVSARTYYELGNSCANFTYSPLFKVCCRRCLSLVPGWRSLPSELTAVMVDDGTCIASELHRSPCPDHQKVVVQSSYVDTNGSQIQNLGNPQNLPPNISCYTVFAILIFT